MSVSGLSLRWVKRLALTAGDEKIHAGKTDAEPLEAVRVRNMTSLPTAV